MPASIGSKRNMTATPSAKWRKRNIAAKSDHMDEAGGASALAFASRCGSGIDVKRSATNAATKQKRRLTNAGTQNVDPDWGPDGSIAYTTKRGGQAMIAVMSPADGDKSARLVTKPGAWEHPSWTRDGRHLVAERDGALFLVDTAEQGDEPVMLFTVKGRCITPSIIR